MCEVRVGGAQMMALIRAAANEYVVNQVWNAQAIVATSTKSGMTVRVVACVLPINRVQVRNVRAQVPSDQIPNQFCDQTLNEF